MKDLAIVLPVRIGSSRVKNKAFQAFGNTDLIGWKLEQLNNIPQIAPYQIIISTDSEEIIERAQEYGFRTHKRDDYFSVDHQASFSELVTHIATWVKENAYFSHIAWTYCVTPFHSSELYYRAFQQYYIELSHGADSLVAVNTLNEFFWNEAGPLYAANKNHPYSQDLDPLFRVTNSLYMAPIDTMIEKEYFLGDNPSLYEIPKVAGIDIDTPEDLEIARALIPVYGKLSI